MKDKQPAKELSPREQAILGLAHWWNGRLVSDAEEFITQEFFSKLNVKYHYAGYCALVTHHCHTLEAKQGIEELGGVINMPEEFSVAYGSMATDQIKHALGVLPIPSNYGEPFDGLTHVYLHPLPPELYRACKDYHMGLAQTKGEIERVLQAPWERLPTNLTEGSGPERIKELLGHKLGYLDFNNPDFVYHLRMLENKFRIAVI